MSYTKTNWVNGSAPAIDADHLNNIETGIYNNDQQITSILASLLALNTALAQLVTTESHSATVTVAASGNGTLTVDMSKSGYTCVGIAGVQPTGTGSSLSYIYAFFMSGGNANVYFRNTGATERTFNVNVYGLYVKNL